MNIHSQKAKDLDVYISSNPECKIGEWPIEIDGNVERKPFYRLPISMLRYNVNNGRLAMEVREWEEEKERKLDADDPDDAKIIRSLLLSLKETDTQLLETDLHQKGQMEPGVITHDGYVINGNRRMAVLQLLHEEESTGRWEKLDVIRLPASTGETVLWKIEAGLQLSKGKVAEYHPVNELLKIKQGINAGLSPKEIAAAMYGRTEEEIVDALERLELIDGFLEFWGPKQKGNYGLIKKSGLHEHFIDAQKAILANAKNQGMSKRIIQERLIKTFAFLRAGIINQGGQQKKKKRGVTHWDVRELGKVFADNDADAEFTKCFDGAIRDPKKVLAIQPEIILESFQSSKEILANKEDRDRPVILMERAIKALQSIDTNSKHLKDERTKPVFEKLQKLVNEIQKIL